MFFVKEHELVEFYEKFGIILPKIPKLSEVLNYIKSQDLEHIKKCNEFDFSTDHYFCFFEALESNNDEIVKVIFDFIKNKEELKRTFTNISPFFDMNTKDRFNRLFGNDDLSHIKTELEELLNKIKILQSQ